jgi:hypothetical protein
MAGVVLLLYREAMKAQPLRSRNMSDFVEFVIFMAVMSIIIFRGMMKASDPTSEKNLRRWHVAVLAGSSCLSDSSC